MNPLPDSFEISPCGVGSSPGVYAIVFHGILDDFEIHQVLYIGSSKNMAKRIYSKNHLYVKLFKLFPGCIYTASYETEDFLKVEKEMIIQLRPIFNSKHK